MAAADHHADDAHDDAGPASATWPGLDYVHDQIRAQLNVQRQEWEQADGRLRLILGLIGIVFAVTLGLLPRSTMTTTLPSGVFTSQLVTLNFYVGVPAMLGLVFYGIAGVVALRAYWPRDFSLPPDPVDLSDYVGTPEEDIKLDVVDAMVIAYQLNASGLARKLGAFRLALIVGAIATGVLGLGVIIQIALSTSRLG